MSTSRSGDSKIVRWSALAAMAAGIALVVKVAYIYLAEGDVVEAVTATLYVVGFFLPLFAAVGVAARLATKLPARIGMYFLVLFVHVFFMMMLSDGIEGAADAITDLPAYVAEELPIALLGIAWLTIGYRMWSSTIEKRVPLHEGA